MKLFRTCLILQIGLFVIRAVAADVPDRSVWQTVQTNVVFSSLTTVADLIDSLPESAELHTNQQVVQSIRLLNGVGPLLSAGELVKAEQIAKSNDKTVKLAIGLIRDFTACGKLRGEADAVTNAIQSAGLVPGCTQILADILAASRTFDAGNYSEAKRQYASVFDACIEQARSVQDLLNAAIMPFGEYEFYRFGGESAKELRQSAQRLESDLRLGNSVGMLTNSARVNALIPKTVSAVESHRQQLVQSLEKTAGFQAALKRLDQLLAENPKYEFALNLKKDVLANRRFRPGQVWRNSIGLDLAYVPPGSFLRGNKAEKSLHSVTLSRGFFIGAFEVTVEQWNDLMGAGLERTAGNKFPKDNVTWNQAVAFCAALSQREPGLRYRLPTEAEWEYACRAGTTTDYNTGRDTIDSSSAAVFDLARPTQSSSTVGSYEPNAWGLYDMHGNLAEWCQDWFGSYDVTAQTNPSGPVDADVNPQTCAKVIRGGSWLDDPSAASSVSRQSQFSIISTDTVGFRVVLEADGVDLNNKR